MRFTACLQLLVLLPVLMHGSRSGADEVEKIVFLFIQGDEIIASNARAGSADRLKLHAKERVRESAVGNAVAVVITNQRYVAYGGVAGGWQGMRKRAGEKTLSIEAQDHSATVVTSDRILTFYGRSGTWSEIRRSGFSFD